MERLSRDGFEVRRAALPESLVLALQGAAERVFLHRYPGGHMFNGGQSIPWLVEQLAGQRQVQA